MPSAHISRHSERGDRLDDWLTVKKEAEALKLPPVLAAAFLLDAWQVLQPLDEWPELCRLLSAVFLKARALADPSLGTLPDKSLPAAQAEPWNTPAKSMTNWTKYMAKARLNSNPAAPYTVQSASKAEIEPTFPPAGGLLLHPPRDQNDQMAFTCVISYFSHVEKTF